MLFAIILSGCSVPDMFFNPPENRGHIIDGINDFKKEQVAGLDQNGDISEKSLDLDTLWGFIDDTLLYIGFNAYVDENYGLSYGIYIFPDSIFNSGATSDPWNRNVFFTKTGNDTIFPPFIIYFWHDGNNHSITSAQFISFNGNWNYEGISSENYNFNRKNHFIEIMIPISKIGNPDSVFVEVFTTGSEHSHPQDTSPEDQYVQFSNPDWSDTKIPLSTCGKIK